MESDRSPRTVPGSAVKGFVAAINFRSVSTVFGAWTIMRTTGPEVTCSSFLMCISPVEFGKFFPQKEHLNVFGVAVDSLPDLLCFSLRLSEHQNIVQSNGTLYVASNDSSFVPSL